MPDKRRKNSKTNESYVNSVLFMSIVLSAGFDSHAPKKRRQCLPLELTTYRLNLIYRSLVEGEPKPASI